jgi:predicted outer membrane protein
MNARLVDAHARQLQERLTIEYCQLETTFSNFQNAIDAYYEELKENCKLFDEVLFYDEIQVHNDAIDAFNRDMINAINKLRCKLFNVETYVV